MNSRVLKTAAAVGQFGTRYRASLPHPPECHHEGDLHVLRLVAGSGQRAFQFRRRKPAVRRFAEARLSSVPGTTACGRLELKRGPESSPGTCLSQASRGQIFDRVGKNGLWPGPGGHERQLRGGEACKRSVRVSGGFGEARMTGVGRNYLSASDSLRALNLQRQLSADEPGVGRRMTAAGWRPS